MKRFSIVEKGYNVDEVNRFIDIVIGRLEKLNAENSSYAAKIEELENKLKNSNNEYDNQRLEKAILAVQETTDRMRDVAKEEARIIVEEAKNNASSIIHEALINAEKTDCKRMALDKNIKVYKERVRSLLEAQLKIVDDLDSIDIFKEE